MQIDNAGKQANPAIQDRIPELLRKGNLPLAEILLRDALRSEPDNPVVHHLLGQIANAVGLQSYALAYFRKAAELAPGWKAPLNLIDHVTQSMQDAREAQNSRPDASGEKFILIKAWGFGFWSDVSHVLGQLLIAELTGRTPIVHWGENSLFGNGTNENVFVHFFEPVSDKSIADLQIDGFDYWPPKWNLSNLTQGELNKWTGQYSRIAGLYLLGRQEKVIISDFMTPVVDLMPWIPEVHPLYGKSIDELWLYLVRRYLHPTKAILEHVEEFHSMHFPTSDFLAVHMRGSDKVFEVHNIDDTNRQYKEIIDRYLAKFGLDRIFLMTDDNRVLDYFRKVYGDRVVTTECQRTDSNQGLHHQSKMDRIKLGIEVVTDVYIAARARAFIGNGMSNPSIFVRYMKDWPEGSVDLVCQNRFHTSNEFLHNW